MPRPSENFANPLNLLNVAKTNFCFCHNPSKTSIKKNCICLTPPTTNKWCTKTLPKHPLPTHTNAAYLPSYNLRNCSMFSWIALVLYMYKFTISKYLKLLHFPRKTTHSVLALIFSWRGFVRRLILPLRLYVRSSTTIVKLDFRFMLLIPPPIHKLLCQSTLDIKDQFRFVMDVVVE